jgi:Raf kinase inhibitor-like YbhB/YbcL family protein
MKSAKKIVLILFAIIVILFLILILVPSPNKKSPINNSKKFMLIVSPSFSSNEKIPAKFTCDGGNINPELQIQNVPSAAKSLALIMDDPDATRGITFTHWLVWNIDPKTTNIKQESKPANSIEGSNDAQKIGYTGPCPPTGKPHRYFLKLYALDKMLDLKSGSTKKELETAINSHVIEKTELIGIYERQSS